MTLEPACHDASAIVWSIVNAAAVIGRKPVMSLHASGTKGRIEMMIVMAAGKVRSGKCAPWRIKAPTKWTIEDSVSGHKRKRIKPRIPIPTFAKPPRTSERLVRSGVGIGFGEIARTKTGPAIEVLRFQLFLVEFLGFQCS